MIISRHTGGAAAGLDRHRLFVDEYCVVARRDHPRINGSIDQAHTADEWVPLAEVEGASRIYEELVLRFGADA